MTVHCSAAVFDIDADYDGNDYYACMGENHKVCGANVEHSMKAVYFC